MATQTQPEAPSSTELTPSGTIALVLGIVGLFTAQPILPAIALYFGHRSRREAQEHPARYDDRYGRIGRILGWVGVVIGIVAIAIVLAVVLT